MSKLSKNIMYNLIGQGFTMVISFVSIKYIFKQLGEDTLGIIYFTQTVNTMIQVVLEMGINSTTVREVSAYHKSEPEYITNLIRTFSLFYWVGFIISGIAVFFLAPVFVEHWINLKTMDAETAIHILRVLGIAAIISLPGGLYSSLLIGLQRMEITNIINVSTLVVQQFGTIMILVYGGGLFYVVYWYAGCYYLRPFVCLLVNGRFFALKSFIPGYFHEVIKRNLKYSSRMMAISITATIHWQSDRLILSRFLPIGDVGYYGVAYNIVSRSTLLTNSISGAIFPSFSALFRSGNINGLMSQYRKFHDLVCFGIVPLFGAVLFALIPLFSYLLNKDVAYTLLLPSALLSLGFYMNGTLTIPHIVSLAMGRPDIAARLNTYALFVVLPATAIFIYFLCLWSKENVP
jgi:O-antigen/teichoic acid export membrane protein